MQAVAVVPARSVPGLLEMIFCFRIEIKARDAPRPSSSSTSIATSGRAVARGVVESHVVCAAIAVLDSLGST